MNIMLQYIFVLLTILLQRIESACSSSIVLLIFLHILFIAWSMGGSM